MKKTTVEIPHELYSKVMAKAAQSEIYQFSTLIRAILTKYVEA